MQDPHGRPERQPGTGPFADASAFMAALPEHDDYLRGLVWATVRDADAIDDIMQATYEQAYRSRFRFEGRSSLRTWLHTICYRTAIDHIRHESSRRTVSLEAFATEPPSAAADPVTTDPIDGATPIDGEIATRTEAVSLLERLEPEQRALLYYTAGLGYSFDEVAEIVGQPRGTVASKVGRAKERLRRGPRP